MPGLLLVGQTCRWEMVVMPEHVVTVTEVLDGHVALDVQCLDRIYLNAYVPTLQTSAQVVAFLSHPLGYPFASPPGRRLLCRRERYSLGAVRQGRCREQAGADGPAPGPASRHRMLRCRRD